MASISDIGIDLGTSQILIYMKGKGIVLREPTVVAIDRDTREILAFGDEAKRMIGRTPGNILAIRPLREGAISDYELVSFMLKGFVLKANSSAARSCSAALRLSPTVACALPSGTDVLIPAAPSWGLTGAGRNMNHSTTKKMHPRIAVKSSTLRLRCRSNSAEGSLHGFLFSVIMVYGLRCNNSGCPISNSDPMSAANRSQR